MNIWYRHSGENGVLEFPSQQNTFKTVKGVKEITSAIGKHHITHLHIKEGEMTSSLTTVCQRLTHLMISNVTRPSQLKE